MWRSRSWMVGGCLGARVAAAGLGDLQLGQRRQIVRHGIGQQHAPFLDQHHDGGGGHGLGHGGDGEDGVGLERLLGGGIAMANGLQVRELAAAHDADDGAGQTARPRSRGAAPRRCGAAARTTGRRSRARRGEGRKRSWRSLSMQWRKGASIVPARVCHKRSDVNAMHSLHRWARNLCNGHRLENGYVRTDVPSQCCG